MRLKPVAVLFHRNRSIRQPPPGASCSLLLTDRLLRSSPGEGGGLACSSSGSTNGLHRRASHHPRQVFLRRVIGILPDASSGPSFNRVDRHTCGLCYSPVRRSTLPKHKASLAAHTRLTT